MQPSPYTGAGGKIRRRPPARAAATPYDRPPAAAAAHRLAAAAAAAEDAYPGSSGEGSGWVSRLVDPASRLIAGGAARLFSTVFRKRLAPAPVPPQPPLSTPPGRDIEPKQGLPESTHADSTPILEGGMEKGKNPTGSSDDKALSEVEHLLMRKTFTRVEFDRLTDLLRARTIESDLPAQVDCPEDKSESRTVFGGIGGFTSRGMAADHSPTADVPICGVSSPAEFAKQFMNSLYSREPQSSSLRSQVFLENKAEASNIAYDRRRSGAPLVKELNEFGNENPVLPVNGYVALGLRGRSAIYRMSRSPFFKGPSSSSDMNVSPFSSSQARAQSLVASGRQVLKRRGTDFNNELGSIGPIRRIRQKSNMMSPFRDARASPRGSFLPSRTIGSDLTEGSSHVQESPSSKRLLLGTDQSVQPVEAHRNGEDGKSSPPVPPQSNKMAEKIFEQLNIIASSPKEQSGQQSVAGNASPSMSKQPVWQDNGPTSVRDPTSFLKCQDLDGVNRALNPDLNGSLLNKEKLAKDRSSKISSYSFQDLGNKNIKSDHVTMSDKPAVWGNSVSATSRKPGFKMAVFEDLSEFDDDQEVPVPSKNSLSKTEAKTIEQKVDSKIKEQNVQPNILEQKVESDLLKDKVVSSPVSEQPITSPLKGVSLSALFSSNDPEKKAVPHVSADNNIGFTFPHVPPGAHPETTVSAPPHASNKDNKLTCAPPFTFGLNQSSTSDFETIRTAGVKTEVRVGESATKPTTLDSANLERDDEKERAEDVHKSSDKVLPSGASTLTAPLHFSSAASTSPSLSNGFSPSSSPKISNVTPIDKPAVSSAASTTFAVSSSSPPISSSPAFPTFNFGSSTSIVAAAKSDSTNTGAKTASILSFGTGGTTTAGKSIAPDTASKTASNLNAVPISSNIATFLSSPATSFPTFSSTATFSSSPVAPSSDGTASTISALSTTLSTAPGVQLGSATPFTFSSSGNSIFGFSSPAQSTGLSTSVAGSTSQPTAASTIFGSKLPQSEGTMSQPSQSSATQFSSPFPTMTFGTGASSSGSGAVSFRVGTSSAGSGTMSFGIGSSSSGPGTVSFGVGASSSGPGTLSFGVGASSSGPATVSFGAGASSSEPGTSPFEAGASSSGPGTLSFGAGASSSEPRIVSFGAGASSSGPATVSFGVTASSSGSGFGYSPFGSGATFSGSGSGFAFSSPSSSAGSSLAVASTSMFSSSSTASSPPAFSNPFGSSQSPPSMFTFGQSASSGGGFSFGAQSAPAFSSQAPVFSFTSASTSMTSSSPQPAFGMTNANTAFSMGSPGNDQMNVEDSMADDNNKSIPSPVSAPVFGSSPFGQPGSSSAAPVFGAPAVQSGRVFQFGSQQGSVQQNPSFPPGGSLEFQGGNFSLGSGGGGGDRSSRRMIKVKRGSQKKR